MRNELNTTWEQISGLLAARRRELGITQEELAAATGMGVATIKRFESGKFWIGLKQFIVLCHHLQLQAKIKGTNDTGH